MNPFPPLPLPPFHVARQSLPANRDTDPMFHLFALSQTQDYPDDHAHNSDDDIGRFGDGCVETAQLDERPHELPELANVLAPAAPSSPKSPDQPAVGAMTVLVPPQETSGGESIQEVEHHAPAEDEDPQLTVLRARLAEKEKELQSLRQAHEEELQWLKQESEAKKGALEKIEAERDVWKQRAVTAEEKILSATKAQPQPLAPTNSAVIVPGAALL
eukprot:GSA120T00023986001.1